MMENDELNRSWLTLIFLLSAFLFLSMGCHGNINSEESETDAAEGSEAKEPEYTEIVITSPESFKEDLKKVFPDEISPKLITLAKDYVIKLLPYASGKNKDKLNEIVKYLEGIEEKPDYLDDQINIVKIIETLAEANIIAAEIEPDSFNVNYPIAHHYLKIAFILRNIDTPDAQKRRVEYEKKALQAAKVLVEKFPNEAKAFSQYAFLYSMVEGDKKKVLELYKRCLEIDPDMKSCRECYDATREALEN